MNSKFLNNTLVNIKPDMTLSVFSGICLTRFNPITNSRLLNYTLVAIKNLLDYGIKVIVPSLANEKDLSYKLKDRYRLGITVSCIL